MSANQEAANLSVGTLIADRYRILQLLGKSKFGQTILAIDQTPSLELPCVLKSIFNITTAPVTTLTINQIETCQIPQVLAEFIDQGIFYQVWEYISGENLSIILANQEIFTPPEVWQILTSLLPVLHQIHSRGIIHGDIKPENIICRLPPTDFVLVGLEGLKNSPYITTLSSPILPPTGSPAYAAPEQLAGKPTFASDLYSLGVTSIYLLTGIHPFSLFDFIAHRWTWRDYWLPEVDHPHQEQANWERQQLAEFLDRLIAPALNQRYNSALTALNHLQTLQGKPKISPAKFMNIPAGKCTATLGGHQGLFAGINAVAIAADGQTLASASDDKTIRLWDLPTGKERSILRSHSNFVRSVAFHPIQPHLLASGSKDRTIKLWDTNLGEVLQTLTGHQNHVNTVSFSPDGKILGSGSADKTIQLWQYHTGEILTTLKGHTLGINAIAFSPQAPLLASASADTTVKLWNLTTGELDFTLTAHTAAVKALAFSPDGKYLATGGEDRTLRIWDITSHQCLHTLSGHPWDISALTFLDISGLPSRSTKFNTDILLSGSWDKTIKLWQISTGENLDTLEGHREAVNCLAAYKNLIISGSSDATIKLWNYEGK